MPSSYDAVLWFSKSIDTFWGPTPPSHNSIKMRIDEPFVRPQLINISEPHQNLEPVSVLTPMNSTKGLPTRLGSTHWRTKSCTAVWCILANYVRPMCRLCCFCILALQSAGRVFSLKNRCRVELNRPRPPAKMINMLKPNARIKCSLRFLACYEAIPCGFFWCDPFWVILQTPIFELHIVDLEWFTWGNTTLDVPFEDSLRHFSWEHPPPPLRDSPGFTQIEDNYYSVKNICYFPCCF